MTTSRAVLVALLVLLSGCGGITLDGSSTASPSGGGAAVDTRTEWSVTVVRVIDGDTIEVSFAGGQTETVRLLGVDTPEIRGENDPTEFEGVPETDGGRAWLQTWGDRAAAFARTELAGEQVTVRTDPIADRRDSFGRLLVYVVHDGEAFNLRLLEEGYARVYDTRFAEREHYTAAEGTARASGVGLWGFDSRSASTTATAGSDESGFEIVEIHADAAGNDHENLNDEYVVFENTGGSAIDLSGWTVRDDAGHVYTVPSGVTLAPGERVTLYTGPGDDTESALYWGATGAIWNNGGDTVYVRDGSGTVVVRRTYS